MKLVLFGVLALSLLFQLSNGLPADHSSLKNSVKMRAESDFEEGFVYQGDMVLTPEEFEQMTSKSGISPEWAGSLWLNNTIPYEFDESSGHTAESKAIVKEAMKQIMDQTSKCVKFVEHTNEPDYVIVKYNVSLCKSSVGKKGGPQYLSMSDVGCPVFLTAHELLHTLGIEHEQSRFDRDDYVKIIFDNIREGYKRNFDKDNPTYFSYYGTTYDYDSIMHYAPNDFGKLKPDGTEMETIQVLQEGAPKIGQRDHLSVQNLKLIKAMYKC